MDGFKIWIDDSGQPCCRPGSLEGALPRIKECIDYAEAWVDAVEVQHRAQNPQRFTRKQEKAIQFLMRFYKYSREEAIREMKEPLGL